MKKVWTFLLLIAGAGAAAYYYFGYDQQVEAAEVVKAAVTRGSITESVKATGTIEAVRTVQVGSQVSGIVQKLHADFNDVVSEGQLIAELDPSILAVQVEIQKANIAQRETDIANQKVQLVDAERNLKRTEELFEKGLTPQQQLDTADLAVKNREASISNAEKQLISAEANLDQAELNLSYTKIYSPIDGVIVNRIVDVGQAVQSSVNVAQFFTIATDLRGLRLTGGVDEADIGKIRPGQAVEFQVDSYPNQTFTGMVENVRLNATVQNNVVTYPVWINVKNPDLKLRPFMTANLDIIVSRVEDVVRVPNTALRFRPTNDIYVARGLSPPAPGPGRGGGAGRQGGQGANATEGGQGASQQPGTQGGVAQGSGQDDRPGAGGAERQQAGNRGTLTEEQRRQFAERFGAEGGGRSGRGGRRGGRAGGAGGTANAGPQVALGEGRIDQYFTPLPPTRTPGTVYTWNAETKELNRITVMLGVTDTQMSELISGDLEVGQEVVTGVLLPQSMQRSNNNSGGGQNNPFQPQRGFGGGGRGR
jgi:HlyD family secretion protein